MVSEHQTFNRFVSSPTLNLFEVSIKAEVTAEPPNLTDIKKDFVGVGMRIFGESRNIQKKV